MSAAFLSQRPEGVLIRVKVVPNASREKIAGVLGDSLKIAVTAPPEGGKANHAVVKLLAEKTGVATNSVTIVRGHSAARKEVVVAGKTVAEIAGKLAKSP